VEQELLIIPEHMSSPPVTRSVCFVDGWLSFCTFSFGHCVVCSSSIYGFWLPLWYLQTLVGHVQLYIHIIHLFNHFKNKYYFKVWSWKFLLFYSWTGSNNTLNLKTVMHVIHKYTHSTRNSQIHAFDIRILITPLVSSTLLDNSRPPNF
jgi:hypothetical protein